jgi:hypothetical protein
MEQFLKVVICIFGLGRSDDQTGNSISKTHQQSRPKTRVGAATVLAVKRFGAAMVGLS